MSAPLETVSYRFNLQRLKKSGNPITRVSAGKYRCKNGAYIGGLSLNRLLTNSLTFYVLLIRNIIHLYGSEKRCTETVKY